MKKTTLLLFILLPLFVIGQTLPDIRNFKVTGLAKTYYPSDHSKVYFEFDIQGDYGWDEIKLNLYYNSVSSSNLINLIRWEGDNELIFPSYTLKETWVNNYCDNTFSISGGKKFILVAEHRGLTQSYSYTVPYSDSDGDDFNDNVDNCPNTPGPDYGCPVGEPDLKFDYNGSVVNGSDLNSTYQFEYYTSIMDVALIINNIGDAASQATEIEFYLSGDSQFDPDDANLNKSISIPSIAAGGTGGYYNQTFYANSDFSSGIQGYWYIIARIKASDGNDTNNIAPIRVYFNPNRSQLPTKPLSMKSNLSTSTYDNSTYDMEIYNFSGSKIKQSRNLSAEDKEQVISELPNGYYIIKTHETKTTKIKKN